METQSVDLCRHRQSTSVAKMSNRWEGNSRNKPFARLDRTLQKSVSESHVCTNLDKEVAGKTLDKIRSVGSLKRNTSFRKSFTCRLKSLPSFRRKIPFKDSETESLGLDGMNEKNADDPYSMNICLDRIGMRSQKRKGFRKKIIQKLRTKKGVNARTYFKSDDLIQKRTTCSDINDSELKLRTQNPHKYLSTNVTLKLTSRLTATSEQVDFTGLITPVAFHPGKGSASTKSHGHWSKGTKNKFRVNTSGSDASIKRLAETSRLRIGDQPNELKKVEGTCQSENEDGKDKSDTSNAKPTNGFVFKENGSAVIAECSNNKPTTGIISPTCADIYGQDEGGDVSFLFPHEHSFSQVQALSHGRSLSQAKTGMMQLRKDAVDKSADLRQCSLKEKSAIKSDGRTVKGNIKDISVEVDKDLNLTERIHDTSACDSKVEANESNVNFDNELKSVVKRSSATLIESSVQSIDKDSPFSSASEDVKSVSKKCSEGYDEVDNPWILRTDLFEHMEKKHKEPHSKSRNFISEYSVDDSMGFSVNQWNQNEHKPSKRKHSADTADEGINGQMNRSNSIESVDSFSSSIHSVHSEDLFFSASEPEMDPDQISVSSSGSSPSDKPMGLLKIDEADEQVSPALIKVTNASGNKKKGDNDELMVKSLNDLNASENVVSSSSSTPRRISSYLSGLRSLSFESSGKNKSKAEKQNQRRSLDSNLKIQQMSLDLNMNESPAVKSKLTNSSDSCTLSPDEVKHIKSSKKSRRHTLNVPDSIGSLEHQSMKTKFKSSESVLKSPLSPVVERTHKSPKKARRRTVDVTPDDESRKFFTMPARRKPKADQQESPRRRVTRIASISKMFSDKAHSLSNIRLGSSFKLRNTDGEKNKVPSFLKTASLTNLMAKKGAEMASSISTLIRGRSYSNTVVNSPFKQKEKPKVSNDQEKNELHYEKVKILCKRNRPVTCGEFTAWKRRLTLNMELANTLTAEETMRLRADSFAQRSHGSGSENGSAVTIRSPTLLDEIMKSVDNTRFRSLGSACDIDDTDDEDSSNEGTVNYVFKKRMNDSATSIRSTLDNHVTVCNKCGNLVSMENSSKQKEHVVDGKMSHSLCDLRKKCTCSDFQSKCLKASKLKPKRTSLISENESEINSPLSSEFSESSSSGSPQSVVISGHRRSAHFLSMFELRESEKDREATESPSKASLETNDSSQGSLLRHKPLLDLSADHLDVTDETDSGVVMYEKDRNCSRERRSQSCDDITNCDTKLVTPDGESFYSCTDMTESDTLVQVYDSNPILSVTKSHSCDDILKDSDNIFIDNGIKNEEMAQHRKELRKAKVKSLSSSHDALSLFVQVEHLDIDTDSDIKEPRKMTNKLTERNSYDVNKHSVSSAETVNGKLNDKEDKAINVNICDKTKTRNCEIDTYLNTVINGTTKDQLTLNTFSKGTKTNVVKENTNTCVVKKRERSFSEKADQLQTLSTKPPLPRKNLSNRKVLSVNDISGHCDRHGITVPSPNKRYSMIEISSKGETNDYMSMLELNHKQIEDCSRKEKVQRVTVKSKSCDFLNSPPSTPKIIYDSNSINSASDSKRFLFDEEHIQSYTLKPSDSTNKHISLQKSVSSGNVPKDSFNSQSSGYSSHSMLSLNRLSQSYSDNVFRRLSSLSPPVIRSPAPEKLLSLDGFINFDDTNNGFSRFSDLPSSPDVFPDMSGPDMDTVFKYDVCLGYLLHSVQCDNRIVCFYSFQRNKQLMESLITPLAVIPDVLNMGPNNTNHTTTPKQSSKAKSEELPNPAAPITSVPSERLLHAGQVLRTVLLARAPHMIRDRKFHLRTYRRCMVGTEMVDWLMQQCSLVHTRNQAVGMWQGLVEEGVVVHVCHEHQFQDKYLFYRFHEDDEGVSTVPSNSSKRECEEELQEMFLMLAQIGPDAMMRMILRKLPHERTVEDLEIIYEELLHIKALSHLSTMVKRELASVLVFESHAKSGTVLFNQGDEGKSWYIILKGSVNVVIYGKGVVCTLHEGDDFGKLALVNDAPRAATIVLRDDNCHFLRVDKDDFNRILRDVEANTVRLKEHGQDVLVLEKIPSNTQTSDGTVHAHYKYSVMAGTPEKMLEHLLETRLDNKKEDEIDGFLEDFILTHVIFMPCNHLCPVLLSHYHSSGTETTDQEGYEFMYNHKKCVLHFVQEWSNIVGHAFKEDHTINAFLEELHSCVLDDLVSYPSLRDDLVTLETVLQAQTDVAEGKAKKRSSVNFTLSRKPSKDSRHDLGRKKSIRPTDENIFKVYCADHTYSTLKLSMDTNVENLLLNIKEKLGLGDDLILCEVKSSGERIILKENDLCVTSGLSINGRLFVTPKEHLDALTPLPEQEGPSEGTFSTIEMFSSREMAYYMTLYDWELFTSVQEYELIYQVFGRYKFQKITANLDLFLRRFNEIQFWIVTEMVLTTQLSKRVALLRKFIKLAAHCKEYQNLNSFFAVVMGLSNIAVSRLSQTWEKLPSKFKKMFVEFETLMDPSRNHRVYRLTVAKMAPPILPFMPLLMKDMTFTHEGNKTYFDGLVNFEKMRMISQTLKTVKFCRKTNIDLEMPGSSKSADAMSYIRNFHVIDNQRLLTQLSHKLEPRKT